MMKKLFFTFFLIFTLFLPLWAQVRLGNFSQKGVATQEMKDDGLVAAHSSLPLNTVIKVKNEANSKEVDVKITNRISNSPSRIIDLSPAAFKALELKRDGIVTISVNSAASSALAAATPARGSTARGAAANQGNGQTSGTAAGTSQYIPVQTTTTAPGTTVTSGQLPGINVVVTNSSPITTPSAPVYPPAYPPPVYPPAYPPPVYPPAYSRSEPNSGDRIIVINTNPNPAYPPPASAPLPAPVSAPAQAASTPTNNSAYLAWMMAMTVEAREMRAAREEREMREAREAREIRELRIAREEREAREIREMREEREAREAREVKAAQIAREEREAREARDALDGLIIGELSR